jgi:hypothetical protein
VKLSNMPFSLTHWSEVEATHHAGLEGTAIWQTRHFDSLRIRRVEYTPGYVADHWCSKGHLVLCLQGEFDTELQDGRRFTLTAGMSYQVADDAGAHRSSTTTGAVLFIVD